MVVKMSDVKCPYCWQEGYVLTHEEDLKKALTALEQKESK